MGDSKHQIMKEEQLTLKGRSLQWEGGVLLLSQVSRIWAGRPAKGIPAVLLLFLILIVAAAGAVFPGTLAAAVISAAAIIGAGLRPFLGARSNAVNIELASGVTCSFLAKRRELAVRACELIEEYARGENTEASVIRLDGEAEALNEEELVNKVEIPEKTSEFKLDHAMTNLTSMDLKKLYDHERMKEEPDLSLLSLIEETIPIIEAGNRQESKIKFTKFIEAGLIQECNELGLNSLIKDIKSSIY